MRRIHSSPRHGLGLDFHGLRQLAGVLACIGASATPVPTSADDDTAYDADVDRPYVELVRRRFDRVLVIGRGIYGDDFSPLWLASVDLVDDGQFADVNPLSRRVYRRSDAPRGSNLDWDAPLLVAAYRISLETGDPKYAADDDAYVQAYLARSVSQRNDSAEPRSRSRKTELLRPLVVAAKT